MSTGALNLKYFHEDFLLIPAPWGLMSGSHLRHRVLVRGQRTVET